MNSSIPTHEEIAQHAYQIYVRNGRKDGQSLDHWLEAEAELRKRSDGAAKPAAATPRASNGGNNKVSAKAAVTAKAAPAAAAKSTPPLKKGAKSAK